MKYKKNMLNLIKRIQADPSGRPVTCPNRCRKGNRLVRLEGAEIKGEIFVLCPMCGNALNFPVFVQRYELINKTLLRRTPENLKNVDKHAQTKGANITSYQALANALYLTMLKKDVEDIIMLGQQQYLNEKRLKEIDKALVSGDKERFLALTSTGWEKIL
ncbi:IDEAL domain-containing protein [Peribacillus sp. SCS-155]|uniref:IDEAL domain-containing protein n=1 Tax=Peribacillus sedimenti TaxID=3115297 RepID=UPI003905E809